MPEGDADVQRDSRSGEEADCGMQQDAREDGVSAGRRARNAGDANDFALGRTAGILSFARRLKQLYS